MFINAVRLISFFLFVCLAYKFVPVDLRFKKIRNTWILTALGIEAGLYLFAFLFSSFGRSGIVLPAFWGRVLTEDFFWACWLHILLSLGIALVLWFIKIWPAGDVKLFIVLTVLFPLMDPFNPQFPVRLSLTLLINAFIVAGIFVLAKSLCWMWHLKVRHAVGFFSDLGYARAAVYMLNVWREYIGEWLSNIRGWRALIQSKPGEAFQKIADYLTLTIFIAGVLSYMRVFLDWMPYTGPLPGFIAYVLWKWLAEQFDRWVLVAILVSSMVVTGLTLPLPPASVFFTSWLAWNVVMLFIEMGRQLVMKLLKKDAPKAIVIGVNVALTMGVGSVLLALFQSTVILTLLKWSIWGLLFGVVYMAVRSVIEENYVYVPPAAVHPYLILAAPALEALKKDKAFYEEHFSVRYADGLTPAQALTVRQWCEKNGVARIATRQGEPFAGWLFAGVFLTLLLKRDVISAIFR